MIEKYSLNCDLPSSLCLTFFILLRYFDMECWNFNINYKEVTDPLNCYFDRYRKIDDDGFSYDLGYTKNSDKSCRINDFYKSSNIIKSQELADYQLIEMIINDLPQPFTQDVFGFTTTHILDYSRKKLETFELLTTLLTLYLEKTRKNFNAITDQDYKVENHY